MSERIVLVSKLYAKPQAGLGIVEAIAEEMDGKLIPITKDNFCTTKQVFIVGRYEDIDAKFKQGEIFRIPVVPSINQPQAERTYQQCTYKASGQNAERIQQSELAEVIQAELPDRNDRTLQLSCRPVTTYIFVQSGNGDCFGPFTWEERTRVDATTGEDFYIELKFITGGGLGTAGRTKQINRIPGEVIKKNCTFVQAPSGQKCLVQNIFGLLNQATYEEYATDDEIVEYIRSLAGDTAGRMVDKRTLSSLVGFVSRSKNGSSQLTKNRLSLFAKIIDSSADQMGAINGLLDNYLKADSGVSIVEAYVQKNRQKYLEQFKKEALAETDTKLQKQQEDIRAQEAVLISLKREIAQGNDEIDTIRRKIESGIVHDQKAQLQKISTEAQSEINRLQEEEEQARSRVLELRTTLNMLEEVNDWQKEIIGKKAIHEYMDTQIVNAKKELNAIKEEGRKEEDELRKKLKSLKPYVDHINGTFPTGATAVPVIKVTCSEIVVKELEHSQRAVIESVGKHIQSLGRSFTEVEVANLLISTQQSFITFFAGLPGVGKTSLCRLLASAQGISPRLHNVAVARGWTAMKDIVGFHNPLNDRFQPSGTGLYGFLESLNAESGEDGLNPMAYVLLDEANLSPIEHYWSEFMGMADGHSDRELQAGDKRFKIPSSLRFLATINYDGTTEPLSPRVLDRASVVVMSPGNFSEKEEVSLEELQALPISAAQMEQLFGCFTVAPQFDADESPAITAITDVLKDPSSEKGRPINISQRKILAMRQYCGRARSILKAGGTEMTALDYAVMQHVLPHVKGHGQKFLNRLNDLKAKMDEHGLEESSAYLARMIAYGQSDLHSYDFFCW